MKKTIILSVMALAFSVAQLNANSLNTLTKVDSSEIPVIKDANPLHMSVVKGDFETVAKIISLGADVNEKWNGMTAAMYAARYNQVEILNLLIRSGANLKLKSNEGHTANDYAILSHADEAIDVITETLSNKKSKKVS